MIPPIVEQTFEMLRLEYLKSSPTSWFAHSGPCLLRQTVQRAHRKNTRRCPLSIPHPHPALSSLLWFCLRFCLWVLRLALVFHSWGSPSMSPRLSRRPRPRHCRSCPPRHLAPARPGPALIQSPTSLRKLFLIPPLLNFCSTRCLFLVLKFSKAF